VGGLALMGFLLVYALPADPIWHSIYGDDLSAFSIPHVVLALFLQGIFDSRPGERGSDVFDLGAFTFREMTQIGTSLRRFGDGAQSLEEVADKIVHYLYDQALSRTTNQRACVLVRLFKTHPFGELNDELREFAAKMLGNVSPSPDMKCLTLLATAGERPEWNSRTTSDGHKAIPLPSELVVQSAPMISQLLSQLGLSFSALQKPDAALMLDTEQSAFNVFHVPEALGSPHVPAQKEFVIPYGVKSVVGFGGLLPTGDLFAVILFSKVHISRESAELFKTLALSTKLAMVPLTGSRVFA